MVWLEWVLAIVYLVSGLNDVFLDLVYYCGPLRRWLAQGRENPTASADELHLIEEKPIAILIPAWDESAVIGAMLESFCDRIDYANYDIFVGTYPNDEATQMEVARAAFDRPRIHRVVCPNPGPTSKADCLNWVVEAIKLKEQELGKRYEIFALEDAEDVVHPLTLKVFNRFVPEYDLIQVPVLPYERKLRKLTGGTYLDEFAEVHLKVLDARLAVGGMIPSAGVGTAFGREACDELAAQTNHVLFPPVSLTEDYDFSFRLFRNGRRSGMARVWVDFTNAHGRTFKELVAIREFFPAVFGDAVRQKQRWMLGIAFQGWEKLGWGQTWRERYMLLRDRIGPVTSLLNAVTAFIVFWAAALIADALTAHHAWNSELGRFQFPPVLDALIYINIAMLLNRMAQRANFVKKIANRRQVLGVPLRLLWGNVIDFCCTVHAVRRYTASRLTGRPLKWLKTDHEFPNVESLLRTHRPLGDLLLERRLISPTQLREALALQKNGTAHLGEILISLAAITVEQLQEMLALQSRSKDRVVEAHAAEIAGEPIAAAQSAVDIPVVAHTPVEPELVRAQKIFPGPIAPVPVTYPLPISALVEAAQSSLELQRPPLAVRPAPAPFVKRAAPRAAEDSTQYDVPPRHVALEAAARKVVVPISPRPPKPSPRSVNNFSLHTDSTNTVRRFSLLHTVASQWKTQIPARRILVAIGTRPEAIKLAPLVCELRRRIGTQGGPEQVFVCATGQHGEMVAEALESFGLRADLDLGVMTPAQTLATVSARILSRFEQVLAEFKPDWVIVQGDTATTAMAGLAAFYAGIQVAHVEAGLRTHNLHQPFPEEFNRRMVGIFASVHFAATEWSRKNLMREGVEEERVVVTGNTGIDALRQNCIRLGLKLNRTCRAHGGALRVLVTAHRRENLDEGIGNLCSAIRRLAMAEPGKYMFVWPLHPNPRVSDAVKEQLAGVRDVALTGHVCYDELLRYLDECDIVLTDSGGLQEEAPSFGKPVLILRETTERPEGVQAGMAWLVGMDREKIVAAVSQLAEQVAEQRTLPGMTNPYGDGHACGRIADYFAGLEVQQFGKAPRQEEDYAVARRYAGQTAREQITEYERRMPA